MKISSFEYHDEKQPGWNFAKIQFHSINLFVGETGSGKTRLLNTIFDIGVFVTQGAAFKGGTWEISLEDEEAKFIWKFAGGKNGEGNGIVINEELMEVRKGGCKRFCVNGHLAGNCLTLKGRNHDRSNEKTIATKKIRG